METWLLITIYNSLSFVFQKRAVHQETAFSITKQNFPSCAAAVGGRDEFVPCNSWLMAIYIHRHVRTISAFPPPPPPPPACRREGKSRLAMGDKSAGPRGAMGGFPTGVGGCSLGLCSVWHGFPRPFSSLKERDGGGCGCVLLQRTQCSSDSEESLGRTIAIICFSFRTKVFVTGFCFSRVTFTSKLTILINVPNSQPELGTFFLILLI